jgi:hypothetical protein
MAPSLCQVNAMDDLDNDIKRDVDTQMDDSELLPFRYLNQPGKSD